MNALAIMTEEEFLSMFPKASKSFLEANPLSSPSEIHKRDVRDRVGLRRGILNKTEAEFAMILEAMKRKGEILRYEFEGITLRFANVKYTPDFVVFPSALAVSGQIKFIEIKGAFTKGKFERAIERFRHARTYWPEFIFELHQKTRDGWRQII